MKGKSCHSKPNQNSTIFKLVLVKVQNCRSIIEYARAMVAGIRKFSDEPGEDLTGFLK